MCTFNGLRRNHKLKNNLGVPDNKGRETELQRLSLITRQSQTNYKGACSKCEPLSETTVLMHLVFIHHILEYTGVLVGILFADQLVGTSSLS